MYFTTLFYIVLDKM